MVLDFVSITILILFFIRGYRKGIIVAAFSVIAILLGIICSLKLSATLADWLLEKGLVTGAWAQIISYAILFAGVIILVRLLAKSIETAVEAMFLGWINRAIGGLLYAFMAGVVWSSLLWIGAEAHIVEETTIETSRTYKYIAPIAPWFFDKAGVLWPMVKDIFADLEGFFDKVNQ